MAEQEQDQSVGAGNVRLEYNNGRTGMNMDQSVNQIPKGTLSYALNASVENFDANSVNYQNEPGNEFCLDFPTGYHVIGEHFIAEQNKHIFFLVDPDINKSEIGFMLNNDCIYHTYVNADCLNFNIHYPIHKAVHKITNCTTEIYWTDGLNQRRFLNLDDITSIYTVKPGTNVCDNETIPVIDCNKLNIQPDFDIPQLTVKEVTTGGSLIAGTYQFAIQYCDSIGDGYTSYYSVTNPTPIADISKTTPNFNYEVGKSIIVNINNIDVTGYFKYFNLAVIKTINNITSVELVGTYFIDDTDKRVTYTGQNQEQVRLTINDIFEKFPYYEIAQDITAVQDILIWDNLTSIDKVNYQRIANQIQLQWQTYKIPAKENYADEINATNLRGYLRDEVYAFEIVFLLKNGKQTEGFHIPGRALGANEIGITDVPTTNDDFVGNPTYVDSGTGIGYSPYWKIYNTASVIGDATGDPIGNATPYKYGEFAYWESEEVYPCNELVWGELSNQPIRHHKFPDVLVSPIFESATPTIIAGKYSVEMKTSESVFPIGVKIDIDQIEGLIQGSSLTLEQKNNIAGFKIVRGDRGTNKSIVAKGILRNVGKYKREETEYYFPNYPYNDLNEDPFLLSNSNAYTANKKQSGNTVCRSFTITARSSSSAVVEYLDCSSVEYARLTIEAGESKTICSLDYPKPNVISGSALISCNTYKLYKLSSLDGSYANRFLYYPPNVECSFHYGCSCSNFGNLVPSGYSSWTDYCLNAPDPFTCCSGALSEKELVVYEYPGGVDYVYSISTPGVIDGYHFLIEELESYGYDLCSPAPLKGFQDETNKYRLIFNSPETSFGQPFLGTILKLENVMYGAGKAHFVEVKDNAKYKLLTYEAQSDALKSSFDAATVDGATDITAVFTAYQAYLTIYTNGITRRNYAYSFNSTANYDYWSNIENNIGLKQRPISICQYLIPGVQSVGDDLNINNWNRESSVYIKTDTSKTVLPFPDKTPSLLFGTKSLISDNTRFTLGDNISTRGTDCNNPEKLIDTNVVAYYASLKNEFVNQWGQMYSYNTIDTGFQSDLSTNTKSQAVVFGGDTFISRFAFKTKLPFFIDNRVNAPDDSDIFYDEIGNIAYPRYWHSARSILYDYSQNNHTMTNIISIKATSFDCPNKQDVSTSTPGRTYYDGKFYLFAYGIPNFYCESSVNTDLRQAFNNKEGDFWPHVSTSIPDDWFQESFVTIAQDNTYYYNVTYSKQNKENFFAHLPVDWEPKLCNTYFPFRAIYSDRQQSYVDDIVNSWLIYRPISSFDFPQNYGGLVSLDGIQNRAVLARFENKSLLYNTLLTVQTSNPQAAYLGNDTLFKSAPPVDFAETDLGYVGSQNKMLLKIPQGQITADAKRGQIFLLASNQATDLSGFGSGLNRFFTDHLAFEILRYFPNADIDNHFNGIGLHGVYDSKYDRVIVTKLDYIPIDPRVKYDETTKEFYIEEVAFYCPTTSSTSSTSTSSTTKSPNPCLCIEFEVISNSCGNKVPVSWIDCLGNIQFHAIPSQKIGTTYKVCGSDPTVNELCGKYTIKEECIDDECPTSTSTTSSTSSSTSTTSSSSTTAIPSVKSYIAEMYDCEGPYGCDVSTGSTVVCASSDPNADLIIGNYYTSSTLPLNIIYRVISPAIVPPVYEVDDFGGGYTTCEEACSFLPVNLRSFGAEGDGSTDDTNAILDAVAYCNSNKVALFVPTGTYMVTRGFNLEDEFRIFGEGPTSLFKLKSGLPGRTDDRYQAAMFMGKPSYGEDPTGQLSTKSIVIKNVGMDMQRNPLNFDATRATYPMLAGIRFFNPISCTIDGVTILNPWYAGIIMQTTSLGISCTLNKIQNCTITLQPNWYSSGVIPISNPLLLGIQLASYYDFATQNGASIYLTRDNPNYIPSRTSYNTIKGNTISGGSHGVTTPNVNHNLFSGNTISGCSHRGFHIISTSDYNTITNNIISNIGSTGIHLAYDCNHNIITNNDVSKILGNEGDCIKSYVNCNYSLISNNTVSEFYKNGIRVAHGANNNTITQNNVKGTNNALQTGIKILANTYNQYYIDNLPFNDELTANNNIVTNNEISNVPVGIFVGDELNFTPPRYNNNTVENNIITP